MKPVASAVEALELRRRRGRLRRSRKGWGDDENHGLQFGESAPGFEIQCDFKTFDQQ